jgi:hypothetical protein
MTRILAVADEVEQALYGDRLRQLRPDLILSCGDLPFEYLECLVSMTDVPLLYVPGNHDPDLRATPSASGPSPFLEQYVDPPGPPGCTYVDGRIVLAAGLRVAGLGGSVRYRQGPNQYTQAEMRWRALRLELRAKLGGLRNGRGVDVFIAHAPPLGLGDEDDPAHRGFAAFHRLVGKLSPKLMVHGHVHPYGSPRPDRRLGPTQVVNAVGYRLLEVDR